MYTHTHIQRHTHTSWEEGTDHKAEADGGYGEDKQEDEHQCGITVSQHSSIRAHLKESLYRVQSMYMLTWLKFVPQYSS